MLIYVTIKSKLQEFNFTTGKFTVKKYALLPKILNLPKKNPPLYVYFYANNIKNKDVNDTLIFLRAILSFYQPFKTLAKAFFTERNSVK